MSNAIKNHNNRFLLFDRYFALGEICCIVALPGVCKTLLACFIARNIILSRVLYFELDDGYSQKKRVEQSPAVNVIYLPEFENTLERLISAASNICLQYAFLNYLPNTIEKYNVKAQKLMGQLGIKDKRKIGSLLLFEIYLKEAIDNGVELIILDSLSALVDFSWEITRNYLKGIKKLCKKNGVSLLILQHTTKKGEYSGTSGLAQIVDTMLYIEDRGGNMRELIVEKNRFHPKENCVFEMIKDGEHSFNFEVREADNKNADIHLTPLETKILDFIKDKESVARDDLLKVVSAKNDTSVITSLGSLSKKGYVKKCDGRSWDIIINCMTNIL